MSWVDLVIPTYNGKAHLRNCLRAVHQQTVDDLNVVVVDDGSTDGTDAMMQDEFPQYRYLRLGGNYGFAAACNAGIASGSAEFVALLNNDAFPEPDWLANLMDATDRYPGAAALASKILLADGAGRLHAAGDTFSWSGLSNSRGVWEHDQGQYDNEEEVFSACAAAALYRRSALNEAAALNGDLFDSRFFMYCEDVDLSWRLRLLGWGVIYVPAARATHHLSATGGGALGSYYVARNSFAVLAKNLPRELARRIWPKFLAHQACEFIKTLKHIREPAARAQLRGILAGPGFAVKARRKRKLIQQARRATNQQLERLFCDSIPFGCQEH